MATGRGLRGWTDGRARQEQAASGELRAGIDDTGGGGGVTYEVGWTCARVQARLGRRTGGQTDKPTAQIEPKSHVARSAILARIC